MPTAHNATDILMKAEPINFQDVKDSGANLEIVEWMWSGTEVEGQLEVVNAYMLAWIDGTLRIIQGMPVKQTYKGPANKFKGFVYSQVMKLGVPFRNLFKNLTLDLYEIGDLSVEDLPIIREETPSENA